MKHLIFSFFTIIFILNGHAQNMSKPSVAEISNLPNWAQMMYADSPNVYEVEDAFKIYYQVNLLEKNYHTQYYKKWRRSIIDLIDDTGMVIYPSTTDQINKRQHIISDGQNRSGSWNLLGPIVSYNTGGELVSQQSNVYCLDESLSNSNVLYCGTEPGEVYRSNDAGDSWFNVSLNDPLNGGVNSVKIHPTNPDIVLIGSGNFIYKSSNGGVTWSIVLSSE